MTPISRSSGACSSGWEAEAEAAVDGWLCPRCDTYVEEEATTTCPSCGGTRPR